MSDMSISPILLSAKEAKRPYALARSSLDTAMQVRALGWGFRKTAAQLYCPNTLESCMLGYLEVKSTKRFDDWYASLRDKGSSSKALSNFAPRELLSITQAKFLCKRLFRVLLKSFLKGSAG